MDAYSLAVTSLSRRKSSRIYLDLQTVRLPSIMERSSEKSVTELKSPEGEENLMQQAGRKPQVGIIGAGVAGLRCADILLRHDFQVTLLEGRNRLGGRVYQEKLGGSGGSLVDLGPNWIHGTKDNPLLQIARETETTASTWNEKSSVLDEHGILLSRSDGVQLSDVMWSIIEDAFDYSSRNTAEIDPKTSLLDFFRDQVADKIPETVEDYETKRHMVLQMADLWGAYVGSHISRQSLKFFWLEESINGENLFCASTYQRILQKIAEPANRKADIRLKTKMTGVCGKSQPTDKVSVRTAEGETFEFDELVVTTPLGWLKRNLEAFKPPLPEQLCKSIGNIGYGCLEKVYIAFPEAFWLEPDPKAGDRTVQGFCQFLQPRYAAPTNFQRWTTELVELGSLPAPFGQATLLFYIHGATSEYITSSLRNIPTLQGRNSFLCAFFEPYYSRLPSYRSEDHACKPAAFLATDWLADELAGYGSYSNFQIGLEDGDRDVVTMRAGAPEMGIWMAGEHTAPFVALGTVTGAYWAGEHVARLMAQQYGR